MTQGVGAVPGTLISWAAGVIGIPASVVRAQINEESGGQLDVTSPTGAQGPAQFEPGTWQSEGCTGSPNNANDAMKCYAKYMYQLVQQEHGNVRNALAAYNAGPGNLEAGYEYADNILADAGQPQTATASNGTGNATLDSSDSSSTASACLIGGGSALGISYPCLMSRKGARELIGGACMIGAGILGLAAMVILAASAFSHPRATQAVAAVAPVRTVVGAVTPRAREERRLTRVEGRRSLAARQRRAAAP